MKTNPNRTNANPVFDSVSIGLTLFFLSALSFCAIGCCPETESNSFSPSSSSRHLNSADEILADSTEEKGQPDPANRSNPQRIVSVVPSITEILFALDLNDRVVGVSRFCNYPPETKSIAKVGGLYDPNLEAIVRLRPELVIVPVENTDLLKRLKDFHLHTLTVEHSSFNGLLKSFEQIDFACRGNSERGTKLRREIEERMKQLEERSRKQLGERPSILISLDRARTGQGIADVYIVGRNPFYQRIIEVAGGRNAGEIFSVAVPLVAREGIRDLNPDIIIDLATDGSWNRLDDRQLRSLMAEYQKDWKSLGSEVSAVRNERIYPFIADYVTIPGPRILRFIEEVAELVDKTKNGKR